ncbi:uncharacterized protein V1516DRAFT_676899 [Lipomyces oligophaga]|uniref:uncharacterized protein n=1 Tax=Lipomyces oligophaga TaxID=45792 RepID=UPI0034CD08D1
MFRKKPNIKPYSPVRSSDRRKLLAGIVSVFIDNSAELPNETKELLVPSKIQVAKFIAHATGEIGAIYVGDNGSGSQRPLWIMLGNDQLVPTVFTLWKCPWLVPILHTWPPVIQKLQNGADMMLPGLVPPFPDAAKQGAIVAIASTDNPSVPIAVGIANLQLAGVARVVGQHGKAVLIVHCLGDELPIGRGTGKVVVPEELSLERPKVTEGVIESGSITDLQDSQDQAKNDATVELSTNDIGTDTVTTGLAHIEIQDESQYQDPISELEPSATEEQVIKHSTFEVDNAYTQALLGTIHETRTGNNEIDLPMISSTFISAQLQRHIPAGMGGLTMKQSSWKKASKFLKAMEDQGLVKIKENKGKGSSGDDVTIISIAGLDHPELREFKMFRVEKREMNSSNSQASGTTRMEVVEYFQIRDKGKPILETVLRWRTLHANSGASPGASRKTYFTPGEVRQVVLDYITAEGLVSANDPKIIETDLTLVQAAGIKNGGNKQTRETLIEGFRKTSCSSYYGVVLDGVLVSGRKGGNSAVPGKLVKGSPPRIEILVTTKMGHKVTRIGKVEIYGLDAAEVAAALRTECAGSTTVGPPTEGSSNGGNQGLEITVQGPQSRAAIAVLERWGVKKQWIEIKETASAKKKKR